MLEKLKPEVLKKRFTEKKQAVREEIELKRCSICKKFRQKKIFSKMCKEKALTCDYESASRLEQLNVYKRNENLDLLDRIHNLEPRIRCLLEHANGAVNHGIKISGEDENGVRFNYECDSRERNVGFYSDSNKFSYMGIISSDEDCDNYFLTNGKACFNKTDVKKKHYPPDVDSMKKFLRCFDDFEQSFFDYIDRTIGYDPKKTYDEIHPRRGKKT